MPERIPFWNIGYPWLFYALSAVALAVFFYHTALRLRRVINGQPDADRGPLVRRVRQFIKLGVNQERIWEKPFTGAGHTFLFFGCAGLLVGAAFEFFSSSFPSWFSLHGRLYLALSFFFDCCGLLALAGAIFLLRSSKDWSGKHLVLLIVAVMVTGFLVEALRIAALRTPQEYWAFAGFAISMLVGGVDKATLETSHAVLWWVHAGLSLLLIACIPNSRLFHLLASPLRLLYASSQNEGRMTPIPDLERRNRWGVGRMSEFTRKDLLEIENCMGCGRCEERCPARLSQKSLNPKELFSNFQRFLLKNEGVDSLPAEAIWGCATCGSCRQSCPVLNDPGAKILEIRRHLVLNEASFPPEHLRFFRNLEIYEDPYGKGKYFRTDWTQGLNIKVQEVERAEWTFWVGCQSAFHDRNRRVAAAVARTLRALNVDFAILGRSEGCCGDPARRAGNEYLFEKLARKNIARFRSLGVKKIVTSCPHCFHSLKYEYPALGAELEVYHVASFVAGLLNGKMNSRPGPKQKIVFHDPCYLGRLHGFYDAPRTLLDKIPGVERAEMARAKETSLCCGGGGGGIFYEEKKGERTAALRLDEAFTAAPQVIATACPYCLVMLEEALKLKQRERSVATLDVMELLERALVQ